MSVENNKLNQTVNVMEASILNVLSLLEQTSTHTGSCCAAIHTCSSVAQSCPTLCNPTDCSKPGFPVPHHLLPQMYNGLLNSQIRC